MAEFYDVLALAAAEVNQNYYRNDLLVDNILADDNMAFIRRVQANGMKTEMAPDGKGYTWYINRVNRNSGPFANNNNYTWSDYNSVRSSGTQLVMSYTELLYRAEITGQEYRTSGTTINEAQVYQFLTAYQEIVDSMIRSTQHTVPFFLMGNGLMRYANYTGIGQTINSGTEGDVLVSELKGFMPGDQIQKYDGSDAAEGGLLRVVDNGVAYGAGTLRVSNETGSNIVLTAGGYFGIPNAGNTLAHGLEYLIDNGVTNSGLYNKYPREASGSPNVGIDRTSATGARSVRARVVDAQNDFGFNTLDQAILELGIYGKTQQTGANDMSGSAVPMYKYEIYMGIPQLILLQQQNRTVGRAYTLEVNGTEDNGLRQGSYSGYPFRAIRCMPADIVYLPELDEFETSYKLPEVITNNDSGIFQKIPGSDKLEHVRASRFHLLARNLTNSVKIINAPGFTSGS